MSTWALANSNKTGEGASGATASASFTFTNAVTSGDLVVVTVSTYASPGLSSSAVTVSDNKNAGNYTQARWDNNAGSGNFATGIYWKIAAVGGSGFQVTLNSTPNAWLTAEGGEFSYPGGDTVSVDAVSSANGNDNVGSPGSLAVTGTDLIIAVLTLQSGGIGITAGTGFTVLADESGAGQPGFSEYEIDVTSSINPTYNITGAHPWQSVAVAFKATAAGGRGLFLPATLALGAGGSFFQRSVDG